MTIGEFKQALREAASAEFQDIPRDDTQIAHDFSPKFQRKMDKLIRNERSSAWHLVNTAAKRAAVILITFLTLSTVTLSVDSIREPVVRFVEKILGISTDNYLICNKIINACVNSSVNACFERHHIIWSVNPVYK